MTETIKQSRTVLAAERLMNITGKGIGVLLSYAERKHQRELAHELALATQAPTLLEKKLELAHNLALREHEMVEKQLESMERMNTLTADVLSRFYGRCASITESIIEKLPLQDLPLRELALADIQVMERNHMERMAELDIQRHEAVSNYRQLDLELARIGQEGEAQVVELPEVRDSFYDIDQPRA